MVCDGSVVFEMFDGLVLSKHQRICYGCIGRLEEVVVPGNVEELCESCFHKCKSLSRVTFGESSSLKLIGKQAFGRTGLVEVHIPEGVEGLCERSFCECLFLFRVTFGESCSLKLIGKEAFRGSGVREIRKPSCVMEIDIPDDVEWLLMV